MTDPWTTAERRLPPEPPTQDRTPFRTRLLPAFAPQVASRVEEAGRAIKPRRGE